MLLLFVVRRILLLVAACAMMGYYAFSLVRVGERVPYGWFHGCCHGGDYCSSKIMAQKRMMPRCSRLMVMVVVPGGTSLSFSANDDNDGGGVYSDDEWHPRDPAHTTPQLLAGLWHQIAQSGTMARGETYTVIYPELEEQLNQQPPRYLNSILAHLDYCKDVCDHFGMTTALTPFVDKETKKIVGFTAKSFKNPRKVKVADGVGGEGGGGSSYDADDDEYNFAYDPYWDDGTDFDALYAGVDDVDLPKDPFPEIVHKVPADDEQIITVSKQWVQTIMSDLGICPFTTSAETSGVPLGPVHYEVTRASTVEDMYVKYWEEVVRVEQQPEQDLSTTLLIAPEFFMDNVELFETFCNTLTQPLTALKVEDLLQLVFFHPHWSFRDGGERATGEGQAANYARRSPWPMINILRTKQVRAAQKGIPTGLVYKQNEKTLNNITADQLETMLRLRDWSALADQKVNRKEMDALKIAQDYQQTGTIDASDMNLANDRLPVANRVVDRKQVEEGNLINVLKQALEKRLGATSTSSSLSSSSLGQGGSGRLTGPETSVASMATEYLTQELVQIASLSSKSTEPVENSSSSSSQGPLEEQTTPQTIPDSSSSSSMSSGAAVPSELERARQANFERARQMLLDDIIGDYDTVAGGDGGGGMNNDRGNELNDVIFGKAGIQARSDADDDLDAFRAFQGTQ